MPLYFGESLGLVAMVVASRRAKKASHKEAAGHMTMRNTTLDTHEAVHCWWILLHMKLVTVVVVLVCLCAKYQSKINSNMQNVVDFNKCVQRSSWCASVPLEQTHIGQSQGVGWLSNCKFDQLTEHAQSVAWYNVAFGLNAKVMSAKWCTHRPEPNRRSQSTICTYAGLML